MPNLHTSGPDTLAELESIDYDLLPACILSTGGLTTPGSGLTLAAVSATGYVRLGTALYYVAQPAISVTVSSTAGNHWLALTTDTYSTLAGWTRRAGSHFVEQANATQPTAPDGAHLVASITVTGANVTAVTAVPSPPLSRQNANAVAITGGTMTAVTITGGSLDTITLSDTGGVFVRDGGSSDRTGVRLGLAAGPNKWNLLAEGTADNCLVGPLCLGLATPHSSSQQVTYWRHADKNGLLFKVTDSDTGSYAPVVFMNLAAGVIGSIATTATTTTYNTASDVRLKENIQALLGALDVVRALHPVSFRWQADQSQGHGFLAHELMTVVPEAVSGLPDEVHPDGTIKPQQVDHSRLVVWLVAGMQELAQQVQALSARVTSLEEQLGV